MKVNVAGETVKTDKTLNDGKTVNADDTLNDGKTVNETVNANKNGQCC